jgi:hypothetical protein
VGWSLLGLIVGFLLGRATRDVHRIAATVDTTEEDTMHHEPAGQPPRKRWWSGEFILGVIVVLLGVLTVAQGTVQSQETTRLQQCQARYSDGFADALDARSESSDDSQKALDALVTTIGAHLGGAAPPDQQAMQQAINDYVQKRRTATQLRAQHPYPPPPRDVCGS